MEYLMLRSYLKMKKEDKPSKDETIKRICKWYFIQFVVISFVLMTIIMINTITKIISDYVSLGIISILLVSLIILIKWDDKDREIQNTDNINKKDEGYDKIIEWLRAHEYCKKNQIKQLCFRCKREIERNRTSDKNVFKIIENVVKLFLVPLYVATISFVFNTKWGDEQQLSAAISIAIIAICGYLIIIGAFKIIAPVANTTYIKMENMIADIQGMLDRK